MKSLIGSKTFWVNVLSLTALVFGSNELKAILPSDSGTASMIVAGGLALVNIVLRIISSGAITGVLPKK